MARAPLAVEWQNRYAHPYEMTATNPGNRLLILEAAIAGRLFMETKQQMLRAIEELPDDANVEDR